MGLHVLCLRVIIQSSWDECKLAFRIPPFSLLVCAPEDDDLSDQENQAQWDQVGLLPVTGQDDGNSGIQSKQDLAKPRAIGCCTILRSLPVT